MITQRGEAHGYGVRAIDPSVWPQYPMDAVPYIPEESEPAYEIANDWDLELPMRDGVTLLLDVYRPRRPGGRFPALCSFSPYSRQLQRDSAPIGQNEAGISEFWVPRGYAHVIVDVRGTNGSGGDWDMWGPEEQRDMVEVIEWVAAQPWCSGRVGMMGCSYFGMTQNQAAGLNPPSLAATFPYDAMTDIYRDAFFPGGIPSDWARFWFTQVQFLNGSSGRNPNMRGVTRHFDAVQELRHPFDGPYWRERSAAGVLGDIAAPAYFGCDWDFHALHLNGAFDAWRGTREITKRMLIGPKPFPGRPFAAYHGEALRWYDQFLKDLDTGVLEGGPIRLWIPGDDAWREETDWPLARTEWADRHLTADGALVEGAPAGGEAVLDYDPAREDWLFGKPSLAFRTSPFEAETEITGPIALTLCISSTAQDADWIAVLYREAPDGGLIELTRGHLRSSHRAVDRDGGSPHQPRHPHDRAEPLVPGEETTLEIAIVPACQVFAPGDRLRLELSNCDSTVRPGALTHYRKALRIPARNTVITGPGRSRLTLPFIPR